MSAVTDRNNKPLPSRFVEVNEVAFRRFVRRQQLVPTGFETNGGYAQTRFLDRNLVERARVSTDSRGTIYEIER